MQIQAGYEITFRCPAPTPLIGLLSLHPSQLGVLSSSGIVSDPAIPLPSFLDAFGNVCTRTTAPEGSLKLSSTCVIQTAGVPDPGADGAAEVAVDRLPDAVLQYLLGSRYCETDKLSSVAWSLFGATQRGYPRVQAITRYVQEQIAFDYAYASATRSAWGAYRDRRGVERDFVHLAVAFCRCMNIPARYCTGYRVDGDQARGQAGSNAPADFSAWLEVYLGERWYAFGPRDSGAPVTRILMAAGRDAADVPIYTTFGPSELIGFRVFADPV